MKRIFKFCLVVDVVVIFLFVFFDYKWFISSQISFALSMFIAYTNFRSYDNLVSSEIRSGKFDNIDDTDNIDDEEDSYLPKVSKPRQAMTFFSPLKLFGYVILGVSFYLLVKFDLMNALGFMAGVLPLPLGTMIGAFASED